VFPILLKSLQQPSQGVAGHVELECWNLLY